VPALNDSSITLPELIHAEKIILASNRGPVEYHVSQDGTLQYRRGAGGLVTALTVAANLMEATWVAMAMTEGDRLILERVQQENDGILPPLSSDQKMTVRYIAIPEDAYHKYYVKISNELLWFTYSYMYDLAERLVPEEEIADAWTNGYCVANQAIADAVCAEIAAQQSRSVVMLQDCFLFLVASMIRNRHPEVVLQQFLHWPWPDFRYGSFLPGYIIDAIYKGLVGNDIIGFQTERDVRNFMDGACAVLRDAVVDFAGGAIWWQGHLTKVSAYPISISVAEERNIIQSSICRQEAEKLRPFLNKKIIMRVDRVDPVKNAIRGFLAYAQLLHEHPELQGEVTFLAFLVPTREGDPVYLDYKAEVFKVIEKINEQYSTDDWKPIEVFFGNNRVRALAAMQFFDVLLVNPIVDSMNLVAKEGALVNQRNGVLVLSRTAGAYVQLGKAVLPISPTNVRETAHSLYKALMLSPEERHIMARMARLEVEQHNLNDWLALQIHDINKLIDAPKGEEDRSKQLK
jgi:trehalose 6-phosphate synthase